jgi:ABC-type glycerol-3-phosphate transport system substrate-binding protein
MRLCHVLFSAALAAVLFVGCGGAGPSQSGRAVKVVFWHGMGGPLGVALDSMVAAFEQENPGIDIELVSMGGYSTLSQKLMGAVQVNAAPTIAQMYESWTTQFHQLDKLVPLDSLAKGPDGLSEADRADFWPAFIEDNTWDGELVTLPFNKSLPVFFYNREMLARAGFAEFPVTWDEWRRMVAKLTDRKQGVWGTSAGVNEWMFGCMLRQQGGDFLDEPNRRAIFNSPAGVRAAEFMRDVVVRDSSAVFATGYDPQNDFLAGKIAVIWGTSVSWTFMRENMTFPVAVAPVPGWERKDVLSFGTNVGIFRGATPEQVGAAWKFIKWFTGTEGQARWARMTSYVPARRSSLAVSEYAEFVRSVPGLGSALAQLEYMSFEPRSEVWFGGRKTLGDALEKVMRGETGAKAALDAAAAEVEREMKK